MNVQLQRYPIRNDPGVILTHPATSAAVDDAGRDPAGVVAMTATSRLRPGARSISGLCLPERSWRISAGSGTISRLSAISHRELTKIPGRCSNLSEAGSRL